MLPHDKREIQLAELAPETYAHVPGALQQSRQLAAPTRAPCHRREQRRQASTGRSVVSRHRPQSVGKPETLQLLAAETPRALLLVEDPRGLPCSYQRRGSRNKQHPLLHCEHCIDIG